MLFFCSFPYVVYFLKLLCCGRYDISTSFNKNIGDENNSGTNQDNDTGRNFYH